MANTTETVFVEFVVSGEEGIESAADTLERTGKLDKTAADQFKKTNAELAKRQQQIDALNKKMKDMQAQNAKTIADLHAKTEQFVKDFAEGFGEGIIETLKEAGFEFDEFGQIVNKNTDTVTKKQTGLRGELKKAREEMARLKLAGQDTGAEYEELAQHVGKVEDALGDAARESRNFASDTQTIDSLISVATGVAGAFSVAQGAVGLFGSENEDLNEVLLKVNSAMAILQGLQAVGNVLQKESAAVTFLAATAQKIYNVVVGETIGLLKLLRIAFAATGIGAIILGFTVLIQHLLSASKATKQLAKDFTRFNLEAERDLNNLNDALKENGRTMEERIAQAKLEGQTRREVNKLTIEGLLEERDGLRELENAMRSREAQARQILTQMATGEREFNEVLADEAQKTITMFAEIGERRKEIASQIRINAIENEKQIRVEALQGISDDLQGRLALVRKNSKAELDLAKQLARAQAAVELEEAGQNLGKRLLIERELQARLKELDAEFARVRQAERIAAAERELLNIQQKSREINARVSQEEIDAQKKVIQEQARLELLQTGLNANERLRIIENSLNAQAQLQKEFNKQANADVLEDLISRNQAELAQLNITTGERLRLQEENLIAAAQIEIDANVGLVDKIKAIRAKLNEDLRALRLASLQKELEDELALTQARTGVLRRANERIAGDQRKTLQVRIAAINQVAALDIAAINSKDDANKESLRLQYISQKEYNLRYEQLKDEEAKIVEDTEIRKRELIRQTQEAALQFAVETAQQVISIVQQFGQQQTDAELQRIEEARTRIDELREAGAITEKEAIARQKRLDQEERTIKRRQAERDKAIAIFQAIINTAAAVARALATGGPVLAAIVGALGAAQITLIASKPIPKFGKGKKDNYQGWAEIGETGPELMERDGDMYLAKKSSVVWVGKHDKVFSPSETVAMLEKNNMQPYIIKEAGNEYKSVHNNQIDYNKLGKTIADNIPKTGLNVDEDGFTEYVHYKNGFTKYLNNRRSY